MLFSFSEIITSSWKMSAAAMAELDNLDRSQGKREQRVVGGEWTLGEWVATHVSFSMCGLSIAGFVVISYLASPLVGGVVTVTASTLSHCLGKRYFSRSLNDSGERMLLTAAMQTGVKFHKRYNYHQRLIEAAVHLVKYNRRQKLLVPQESKFGMVHITPAFLPEEGRIPPVPDDSIYRRVKAKRVRALKPLEEERVRPMAPPEVAERVVHWAGYPDYVGEGGEVVRFKGGATGGNVYGFFNRRKLTMLPLAEQKRFSSLFVQSTVVASQYRPGIKHLSPSLMFDGQVYEYEIKDPTKDARVYGRVVVNDDGKQLVEFDRYRAEGVGHFRR